MVAALVQTSVNAGAAVTGGVTAPSAATIQWSGVNTSGWLTALWEVYDFPPGFATPAGWSLNSTTNVLFYNGITPPVFSLPATSASAYGKWMPRLTVNGGISNGLADSTLIDTTAGVKMLSPLGQPGTSFLEDIQFSVTRAWKQDLDASLRALEGALVAGATTWADCGAAVSEKQIVGAAGTMWQLYGANTGGSTRYVFIFDAASRPSNGVTSEWFVSIPVDSGKSFSLDLDVGRPFAVGLYVGVSSTQGTFTYDAAATFLLAAEKQ